MSEQLELFTEVLARIAGSDGMSPLAKHVSSIEAREGRIRVRADADLGSLFAGLPVDVVPEREPEPLEPGGEADWLAFLYDLFAHVDPMSYLGRRLTYVSVSRKQDKAVVRVTDGRDVGTYELVLSELFDGAPDDLALDFLAEFPDRSG